MESGSNLIFLLFVKQTKQIKKKKKKNCLQWDLKILYLTRNYSLGLKWLHVAAAVCWWRFSFPVWSASRVWTHIKWVRVVCVTLQRWGGRWDHLGRERQKRKSLPQMRARENVWNLERVKKVRQVLTGSSCTVIGLKGTLQRPNSWESTLISLCLGDTTFTWKETNMNCLLW